MGTYLPNSVSEQKEMLDFLGLKSLDDLFSYLPKEVLLSRELNIPPGKSESEVLKEMAALAGKNKIFPTIFRGAGAYRHYVPSLAKATASKESFVTAYTPYQPEISQGVLQSIFEFQTMICELMGLEASNASVYDGATACAEAVAMCAERKRQIAFMSGAAHPDYVGAVKTYCYAAGRELVVVPEKDGRTDIEFLKANLKDDSACFILQSPNYYGLLEDADAFAKVTKDAGAKFVLSMNPIYMAIGKTPGECGADIGVAEGQPLGNSLGFGGPYLGLMTATKDMARKLPGRIVGKTVDIEGKRAFVLTMQAREQHIRREKATSSICSNQALCAIAAGCYMATMGPSGMKEVAKQCLSKAHYAAEKISAIPGFELAFKGEFFHEFVTKCPKDPKKVMAALEAQDILGGHVLTGKYENHILWCCTEVNTKEEIDKLAAILKEVA